MPDQRLADALDKMTQAVATVKGQDASILEFIKTGIPGFVKTAVDASMALGATPEELAPFDQLGSDLTASAQEILDAINANPVPAAAKRS